MNRINVISILTTVIIILAEYSIGQVVYFNNHYNFQNTDCFSNSVLSNDSTIVFCGTEEKPDTSSYHDLFIAMLDTEGNILTHKSYGYPRRWYTSGNNGSLKKTIDGGYVLAASIQSTQFRRAVLWRFDESGDTIWTRSYADTMNFEFSNCVVTDDTSYVMVGTGPLTSFDWAIFLLKTDKHGNEIWRRWYGEFNNLYERGISIIQTEDKGFIVGGDRWFHSYTENSDPIIVKFDSLGNYKWNKTFGGEYGDSWAAVANGTNNSCVVGFCYTDSIPPGSIYRRIAILKVDSSGLIVWNRRYGNSIRNRGLGNILSNPQDNSYMLCGTRKATLGGTTLSGWIIKVNDEGDSLWCREYLYFTNQGDHNLLYDMSVTEENCIVATGQTREWGTPDRNAWLIKLDSVGCDTPNCDPTVWVRPIDIVTPNEIRVVPNPFTTSTTLLYSLDKHSTTTICIFNSKGQLIEKIEQEQPKGEQQVQWNAEGLPAGIYYYRLQAGEMAGGGKMIKME